jgi:hypothetical protein
MKLMLRGCATWLLHMLLHIKVACGAGVRNGPQLLRLRSSRNLRRKPTSSGCSTSFRTWVPSCSTPALHPPTPPPPTPKRAVGVYRPLPLGVGGPLYRDSKWRVSRETPCRA